MTRTIIQQTVELEVETCSRCGVSFAAPVAFFLKRREDGTDFYCPVGHALHYPPTDEMTRLKNEAAQLTRQLEIAETKLARGQTRINELATTADEAVSARIKSERELARVQKRVANGVCPCCHRHFVNVERHMKSKHPSQ